MALSIGELVAYLKVDDSQFNQGLNKTERRFGGAGALLKKTAKVTGAAVAAGLGYSLVKGWGRLTGIENAQAKLRGLGHDADTVDKIMDNALTSVKGTAFGLDEAAGVAASAVAAGIKPGKQLSSVLTTVADAAAVAGTDMGSMGAIFNKVAAANKVQMDVINQLHDAGVPALALLAKHMGVTAEEASKMASQGKIDFATFHAAMTEGVGGAAKEMGNTTTGALMNMKAAAGRLGASLLSGLFPIMIKGFQGATEYIDKAEAAVGPASQAFGQWLADTIVPLIGSMVGGLIPAIVVLAKVIAKVIAAVSKVIGFLSKHTKIAKALAAIIGAVLIPVLIRLAVESTVSAAKQAAAWTLTQAQAIKAGAVYVAQSARMVAAWVLMGVQATMQAARMAAAWVVAMGPVGWVTAAVVALVALIVTHWDTVKAVTAKVWKAIGAAVKASVEAVKNAVKAGFQFITRIFLNFTGPGLIIKHWDKIKSATRAAWDAVRNFVKGGVDKVLGAISALASVPGKIAGWFQRAAQAAGDQLGNLLNKVRELPGKIVLALSGLGQQMWSVGKNIVTGIMSGIKAMGGWIVSELGRWVSDKIPGPIKKVLGISSPSRVMAAEVGRHIPSGIAMGIDRHADVVTKAGAALARKAVQSAQVLMPAFGGAPSLPAPRPAVAAAAPAPASPERHGPLIGTVIQQPAESADQLAERLWFKTRTRG